MPVLRPDASGLRRRDNAVSATLDASIQQARIEQCDIAAAIGTPDRATVELLARAGLRRSDLAGLTLSDIRKRGRQPDARRRTAIAPGSGERTALEVI